MSDLLFFAPFIAVPLLAFSVLPPFFGRFFLVLAIGAFFWVSSMSQGPDSPGLVYGLVAQCVALAAILGEGVHMLRRAIKRRPLARG